jgi:hypothetical protein
MEPRLAPLGSPTLMGPTGHLVIWLRQHVRMHGVCLQPGTLLTLMYDCEIVRSRLNCCTDVRLALSLVCQCVTWLLLYVLFLISLYG